MEERDMRLEIAKMIGEPINTQLPVPFELAAIADTETAEAGEKVFRFSALDSTADVVLAVNTSTGAVTDVKRTPVGDAELTFQTLVSKKEYVLIDAVLAASDTRLLASRRESIVRGMDKREVQLIIAGLLAKTAGYLPGTNPHEITVVTADDLYDVILKMKHAVEDYGDGYVLLCGSTVKEAIDTWDKDRAGSLNYNVNLTGKLRELGIEVVKVFGKVSSASNETEVVVMDAECMILVAKNSRIAKGKPIQFVRRKISAEMAQLMGASVDTAQRALIVDNTPTNISGTDTWGYGVMGIESVIFCITNPKAICICDASLLFA